MHQKTRETASIIIPAYNEQRALGRLLTGLLEAADPGEFEIVVACNGCTDATADVARSFGRDVLVVELPEPSKRNALKRGDDKATLLPRIYLDADVEIRASDVRALLRALDQDGVLAAAPTRVIPRAASSPLVRGYYDIWEQLPQVRTGLFGRGVVAVSAGGYERIRKLPAVMSDDLVMSEAFGTGERVIVADARVVIRPPRTLRALVDRRIRVYTGTAQLDQMGARSAEAKTSRHDLLRITCIQPKLAIHIPIFLGVATIARLRARRRVRVGDFETWLRDESSRQPRYP